MKIGIVGNDSSVVVTVRRLLSEHQVAVFNPDQGTTARDVGATLVPDLPQLARTADVLILGRYADSPTCASLLAAEGLSAGSAAGKIVIDQRPGDPDQACAMADELQSRGVDVIDALVHAEASDSDPARTTMTCGGRRGVFDAIRPVLTSLCPNPVYCGDAGGGRAAALVLAAVAACNRLIAYECAVVGAKHGLALEHMATVLDKSSGYNSAATRILPLLGRHGRTADESLGTAVEALKRASRLAMRCGTPSLFANLACSMFQAAASSLGSDATLDELARTFEAAAAIDFADSGTWGSPAA